MTDKLIVCRKKIQQFDRVSAVQTHCARLPQLVSKNFGGRNFCGDNFYELAFDCKSSISQRSIYHSPVKTWQVYKEKT